MKEAKALFFLNHSEMNFSKRTITITPDLSKDWSQR